MIDSWNTKYGPRRIKQAPPTLGEAIFAAKGLTDNLQSQIEIAASLMGLRQDVVRAEIIKSRHSIVQPIRSKSNDRGFEHTVVVERRVVRRPVNARRFGS